jgi:hypothetical protein
MVEQPVENVMLSVPLQSVFVGVKPRRWGVLDVIAVGIGGLLLSFIPIFIDTLLTPSALDAFSQKKALPVGWTLRSVIFSNVALAGFCFFYLWFVHRQTPAALGLRRAASRSWLWFGVIGGIALFVLGENLPPLMPLGADSPQAKLMKALVASSPLMKALAFFVVAVVAPIGEEIFFRGFAYQGIKNRWGAMWGAALSSLAFALMHGSVPLMLTYFFLGLILTLIFQRTRTLAAPILAHSLNNFIGLCILLWAR